MSTELEHEQILPETSQEETVDLNDESFENFDEFEELSYGLSEEASDEYSGYSIFTESSIETYKSPVISVEETVPEDPLMPVPPKRYPDMLFLMGKDFPKAIHAHAYVRSLIKWKKICPKQKIEILAPGGNYKNGLFFFSIYKDNFYGSAYCHEKTDKSILNEALSKSRYVPVQDQYNMCRLSCLNYNTLEAVGTIISKENWCLSSDVVLWLPWYCAREVEVHLPHDGVKIRKLGLEHMDLINESWQDNFPGSRDLLDDMFQIYNGLGLFAGESLLSWAFVWYHGGIGIIQTIESEKGKGYCRPVVEALTKGMGDCLIDVHLKIPREKRKDIIFFSELGFRHAFKAISCETKKNEDEKNLKKIDDPKSQDGSN
ncbi:unnamed protein product [Nezara viridula]|uniref:GCN5-related N-acetyltransferase Rv2170-like domain-containing protein n=1 Tax=Nezara viridula TaxID=85310 RepID=A0A9P0E148_NEZVI|nr:unnamed protein product [Nezara viridula]